LAMARTSRAGEPAASSSSSASQKRQMIEDEADFFIPASTDDGTSGKRRKTDPAAQITLKLRGNPAAKPAKNPPLLTAHPLREDQRRSLAWMLERETGKGNNVKGGILADKMGYGKTATAIGLISLDKDKARQQRAPQGYIPCSASLILSPSHLMHQWQDEIGKFLGQDRVKFFHANAAGLGQLKKFVEREGKSDYVAVLVVHEALGMKNFKGSMMQELDIVLVSYKVQASQGYASNIRSFLHEVKAIPITTKTTNVRDGWGILRSYQQTSFTNANMGKKMEYLRKTVSSWSASKKSEMLERAYPVLEMFWWDRIIMDEFHESESWVYRVCEMFKSIGARHRWGLSGTPPVGSLSSIKQVAEILWYEGGLKTEEDAQAFLNIHVLQNSSADVEGIALEEHVELVTQTMAERAIYRQACHDNDIFDLEQGYESTSLKAREALLKCCAHFACQQGRDGEASAQQELERLGDRKQERIKDLQSQLQLEAVRAQDLQCWASCQAELRHQRLQALAPEVAKFAEELAATDPEELQKRKAEAFAVHIEYFTQDGEVRAQPKVSITQKIPEAEIFPDATHRHCITHYVARQADKDASNILDQLQSCSHQNCNRSLARSVLPQGVSQLLSLLDAAHRSLRFFQIQLQSIQGDSKARTCSICLDEDCDLSTLCILPCGHLFHTSCVRDVVRTQSLCPECRAPLSGKEISSLQIELSKPKAKPLETTELCKNPTPYQRLHGSKLSAVAQSLSKVLKEDPASKVLVFVQWADLETRVGLALKDLSIAFLKLPHRLADAGIALKQFQEDRSVRVIILSLQRAAAGANLTAANHVFFVHPMNAETAQAASAYEKQAIGRVRRLGQKRSEIHVHRFIARGTVEEHICKLHDRVQ